MSEPPTQQFLLAGSSNEFFGDERPFPAVIIGEHRYVHQSIHEAVCWSAFCLQWIAVSWAMLVGRD